MKLSTRLLRWYDRHGRKLPWRRTRDPYRILVSEMMLQQTQVPRVLLYYHTWLKRFPTWKALAEAGNADVIRAWVGLGYNRRALMLRDIACEVVARGVPKTEGEWRRLKGIGAYTAAAVVLFSRGESTLPIDTNVRRVLGRVLLGKPYPEMEDDDIVRTNYSYVLEGTKRHADVVQALFDLASSHCAKVPDCASCPLRRECHAAPKFLSSKPPAPKRLTKPARERIHRNKKYPDRIYRGRILKAIREAPEGVSLDKLGGLVDAGFEPILDTEWLLHMARRLERDGLAIMKRNMLFLP